MFGTMCLVEGKDFYWEEKNGVRFRVFTEQHLKKVRDFCCSNECKHCPFKSKSNSKSNSNN